jgi:Zn finger protein HypA/HybF involved in hydrogenase expression
MADLREQAEAPFIRNDHGLWCPQCGEMIAEWEWVGDCDACGYPSRIEDDDDDY